jgi:hypothetical protein
MSKDTFVIISAARPQYTPEGNKYRYHQLTHLLREFRLTGHPARGCYQGECEDSRVVPLHWADSLDKVRRIARGLDQESILVIDEGDNARLEFIDGGDVVDIGKWTRVDKSLASSLEAWTEIDGALFTCVTEEVKAA